MRNNAGMPNTRNVPLLVTRRTKIVATIGPASSDPAVLEQLFRAGVNVVRLNMSHGTHDSHRQSYENVRTVAERAGVQVAVLADLCGPKIRVGTFPGGKITLPTGGTVTVTTREVAGVAGLIPSEYDDLAKDVTAGDRILLDDGNLELRVEGVDGTEIRCAVVHGGVLKDRKGMNLPGVKISAPSLTEKDRSDARFALELGVDFIALSFVRQASDVEDLKALVREQGADVPVVAKIEKPEAMTCIEDIVKAAGAIMVARGDLGVEMKPEEVPNIQEQLVDLARAFKKPVIVATQMLESMIVNPRPTRAEVTDVANAVRSGADAVMLSGETASGAYPVEAVQMMDAVIRQVETHLFHNGAFGTFDLYNPHPELPAPKVAIDDGVAQATALLSRQLRARGIVAISRGGWSMGVMSAARPAAPLVGVSPEARITRRGCLLWGVVPVVTDMAALDDPEALARRLARECGIASAGEPVLVVRGLSADPAQGAPSITVLTL
jgi:pyruvate kinase